MKSKITNYKDVVFYIFMAILAAFIFSLVTKTIKTVEGLSGGRGRGGNHGRGGHGRGGHGRGGHHTGGGHHRVNYGKGGYYPNYYYGGSGGGWWDRGYDYVVTPIVYTTPVVYTTYVDSPSWYDQFIAYIRSLFYPKYSQIQVQM